MAQTLGAVRAAGSVSSKKSRGSEAGTSAATRLDGNVRTRVL